MRSFSSILFSISIVVVLVDFDHLELSSAHSLNVWSDRSPQPSNIHVGPMVWSDQLAVLWKQLQLHGKIMVDKLFRDLFPGGRMKKEDERDKKI